MNIKEYRLKQFENVNTEYLEYTPKLKILKPNGQTKWMDIDESELQKIKEILTK